MEFERRQRNLSQMALAGQARIHQTIVSGIERGRFVPTAEELQALASVLGVSPPSALMRPVLGVVEQESTGQPAEAAMR
jgi:transcriptional regulator with XRE-family HTH domain